MATAEGQAMGNLDEIAADLKKFEARAQQAPPAPATSYEILPSDAQRLANDFTFHTVKGDQAVRYESLRATLRGLAAQVLTSCPPSRERSLAITKLEEAGFWANASIARNE